ncbi:MAG: type II toxin-antitoxin system YafQ family toxin [Candidatus Symbiobacter sp.]|nr:type II toxin-antitoxin system YafQ family toxin [Candidatus Symbiobacter sp.]
MRLLDKTNNFERDYVRVLSSRHGRYLDDVLQQALYYLINDTQLPPKYRDHALMGKWHGYRECHLRPDLLLIYKKPDATSLVLHGLGSHSQLRLA